MEKIAEQLTRIEKKLDKLLEEFDDGEKDNQKKDTKKRAPRKRKPKAVNKVGDVIFTNYNDRILITGNTYDRRDMLKSHGAKWEGTKKGWAVPVEKHDALRDDCETYCKSVTYKIKDEFLYPESANQKKESTQNEGYAFVTSSDESD